MQILLWWAFVNCTTVDFNHQKDAPITRCNVVVWRDDANVVRSAVYVEVLGHVLPEPAPDEGCQPSTSVLGQRWCGRSLQSGAVVTLPERALNRRRSGSLNPHRISIGHGLMPRFLISLSTTPM
jgi:hypothetical protein